jgi:hypothetical protein
VKIAKATPEIIRMRRALRMPSRPKKTANPVLSVIIRKREEKNKKEKLGLLHLSSS